MQRALSFRPEKGGRAQVTLNLTPLIDVLFLFIIFFMLTGTFKRVGELRLSLPEAETAAPAASADADRRLDLVATEDGRLLLEGLPIELSRLDARLRELLAAEPGRGIMIKAESGVRHGRVVKLLDIVRGAGFAGVGIGTQRAAVGDSLR